jgi:hypothetical protein
MKRASSKPRAKSRAKGTRVTADDLLPEYDVSKARRNPYAARFVAGSNVVVLDPDVAAVFPTGAAVNDALRALAGIIQQRRRPARKSRRTA